MNTQRRIILIIMALALLAVPLAAVAAQHNATTLLVAYIGASGGSQAAHDQNQYQAAVLAAEEINTSDDAGVIYDDSARYQFSVVYYSADTADEALDAYRDAVIDGAVAVLGPDVPGLFDALADQDDLAVPLLYNGTADVAEAANIFRLTAAQASWADAIADYLANARYAQRLATVAVNTATAQAGVERFINAAGEDNIVLAFEHAADDEAFLGDAAAIEEADADAVLIWTLDAQAIALLEALRDVGWEGTIVYAGLDADFVAQAGPDLTAGLIGPLAWSAAAYDDASRTFVADYTARWGELPADGAAAAYDALYLLAEAVQLEGDDVDALAYALDNDVHLAGVAGTYNSTEADDLRLMTVSADGSLHELARYDGDACLHCADLWYPEVDAGDTVDFTIALLAPLDGPLAATGEHLQQAAQLAVREINNRGGVTGADEVQYTLRLRTYEVDATEDVEDAFARALADGAQIILGPDYNVQVDASASLAASSGVIQLISATGSLPAGEQTTEDDLPGAVLAIRAGDSALATAAVSYLLDELELTNLATVAVRADYALNVMSDVESVISRSDNGNLVLSLDHSLSEEDFASYAADIAASDSQAVLVWTTPPAASALLAELGAAGWQGVFVYGYLTPSWVEGLTVPEGIEVIGPVGWWDAAEDGTSATFAASYESTYREAPIIQSAAYYDAVHLLANGLREVGGDTAELQAWLLESASFTGVQGLYSASSSGQLTGAVMIVQVGTEGASELYRVNYGSESAASTASASSSSDSDSESDTSSDDDSDGVCSITAIYSVNLRSAANADADVLAVIPYQITLTPTGVSEDGWYQVTYDDYSGYVYSENFSVDSCAGLALVGVPLIYSPASGTTFAGDAGTARIMWEPVDGAATYRVQIIPDQAGNTYRGATFTTMSGYIDLNLIEIPARTEGWGYWVRVTALDGSGEVVGENDIYIIRTLPRTAGGGGAPAGGPGGFLPR